MFRSAVRARRADARGRLPAAGRAGLRRPRHVGEDRPEPALERAQVHVRGGDRACGCAPSDGAARADGAPTPAPAIAPSRAGRGCSSASTASRARARAPTRASGIGLALVAELAALHGGAVDVDERAGRGHALHGRMPFGSAHLPRGPRRRRRRGASPSASAAAASVAEALRWLRRTGAASTPRRRRRAAGGDRARGCWSSTTTPTCATTSRRCWPTQLPRSPTAADGAAALGWPAREPPDLVLTDVMMPRLDGFGLLARAARRPAHGRRPGDHALGPRRARRARSRASRPAPTTTS